MNKCTCIFYDSSFVTKIHLDKFKGGAISILALDQFADRQDKHSTEFFFKLCFVTKHRQMRHFIPWNTCFSRSEKSQGILFVVRKIFK